MAAATSNKRFSQSAGPLPSGPPEEPDFIPQEWRTTPRSLPSRASIGVLGLIAFFAVCWLYVGAGYLREAARLARAGPETGVVATIVFAAKVAPVRSGDPRFGRVDVRYADETGASLSGFVRVQEASLDSFTPGGTMRIWPDDAFLAQIPVLLTLDGLDTLAARQRAVLVSGLPVFLGGVLAALVVAMGWRRRQLFAGGKVATGKILEVSSDWATALTTVPFGVLGVKLSLVRYRFQASSGPVASHDRVFRFPGAAGDSLVVVYDADNPSRNLVYALKSTNGGAALL